MRLRRLVNSGFTLIEMVFGIMILGLVLIAFTGIFMLFQRSSAQTSQFAEAQQNARVAVDFVTEYLRQAGSSTDFVRGQRYLVHAGPYQVAINADIDNGEVIGGEQPMVTINRGNSPNSVPTSGTIIYTPDRDFLSDAETVVLTLDSNNDGTVTTADRGDDPEESGNNNALAVLKRSMYGEVGGNNVFRSANLALIRGPMPYTDGTRPQPLFQYYYDHDNDDLTPHVLWGDDNPTDGELNDAEIAALTPVADSLLTAVSKIKVTVTSESETYNEKFKDNRGYLSVTMNSEVYLRNSGRTSSVIYGTVYFDINGNGVLDDGESGLPNVEVSLAGGTRVTQTNSFGIYYMPLPPGDYSIKERDLPGFSSTTPNLVSVSLLPGMTEVVNFGDSGNFPTGTIEGYVFEDLDEDGLMGGDERGLDDVLISLDSGEETKTDITGYYTFTVQLGTYNVTETDPGVFASTTPNTVNVQLLNQGDQVVVNFGDLEDPEMGFIAGSVFLDLDKNGSRSVTEDGIGGVTLILSDSSATTDSTLTSSDGNYKFTVPPGSYSLMERDPTGMISTTVNNVVGIKVTKNKTETVNFGDIRETYEDFIEIIVGTSNRALSISAVNTKEDGFNDADIILGTPDGGKRGNLLVFRNAWESATTPRSSLFPKSEDIARDAGQDINAMVTEDFSGDALVDILTGMEFAAGANLSIFGGLAGGEVTATPVANYQSSGSSFIMATHMGDVDNDGDMDLVAGLANSSGTMTGGFEVFEKQGNSFVSVQYVTTAGAMGLTLLGEIWALALSDIDVDGDQDLVVGSHTSDNTGFLDVYKSDGSTFIWHSRYMSPAVNRLELLEFANDNLTAPDIITAVSTGPYTGGLALWLNDGFGNYFGEADTTGYKFPPDTETQWPHDFMATPGEALDFKTAYVNPDIFPDLFIGTRRTASYQGDLLLAKTFGLLPTEAIRISTDFSDGEVVALDTADFDKDNLIDVVVGTRDSVGKGKIVVYFLDL